MLQSALSNNESKELHMDLTQIPIKQLTFLYLFCCPMLSPCCPQSIHWWRSDVIKCDRSVTYKPLDLRLCIDLHVIGISDSLSLSLSLSLSTPPPLPRDKTLMRAGLACHVDIHSERGWRLIVEFQYCSLKDTTRSKWWAHVKYQEIRCRQKSVPDSPPTQPSSFPGGEGEGKDPWERACNFGWQLQSADATCLLQQPAGGFWSFWSLNCASILTSCKSFYNNNNNNCAMIMTIFNNQR